MPILFTLNASINDFESPNLPGANGMHVHFDLNIRRGDLIRVTGDNPMLIDYQRVSGYIRSDGQMYDTPATSAAPFDLDDPGTLGVRLLANDPDFNLDPGISYKVSFEQIWRGRNELLHAFNTPIVPSVDTTVDLSSFAPGPGLEVVGIPALGLIDDLADVTTVGKALMRTATTIDAAYLPSGRVTASGITDSTTLGRTLVTASSTAVARKALKPPVFDARDFGVIADGQKHNNVANLRDALAAVDAAGGGTLLLPPGVINTSEAVYGNVTADSGAVYENLGWLPVPGNNKPIHITGGGKGVTTLKLSPGLPMAWIFPRDWGISDGQRWKNVLIENHTIDRANLLNTDIGPKVTVTTSQTIWSGTWAQVPIVPDQLYKNVRVAWVTFAAGGTREVYTWQPDTPGGGILLYAGGSNLVLSPGDTIEPFFYDSAIGTNYVAGFFGNGGDFTLDRITVRDIDIVNVATKPTPGGFGLGPMNTPVVAFSVAKAALATTPTMTNILCERVRVYGGNSGFSFAGSGGAFLDSIYCVDCYHDTQSDPNTMYYSSNYIFGSGAWLGRAGVIRCVGKRSGDVGLEVDNAWDFIEEDCVWEDACNSTVFLTNFQIPAETAAGPKKTTLAASITDSATTATITALPDGVDRTGIAYIGTWPSSGEVVGYKAAGTTLTLTRGLNGTTAAAHDSGVDFTFVETHKTRFRSINQTIRNHGLNHIAGNSNALTAYYSHIPHPPIAYRNPTWQYEGNPRSWHFGMAMYLGGWMLDVDIEGLRFTQSSLVPQPTSTLASIICLDWPYAGATYAASPPIPAPRIRGRNNKFSVSADISTAYSTTSEVVAETVDTTNIVGSASGFESGSWGDYTISTEQAHSGTKSLKITSAGGYTFYQLSQPWGTTVPITAGRQYYGEVWVKAKSTNINGGGMNFVLVARDSSGVNPEIRPVFAQVTPPVYADGWVKLSGVVTIPPGYDRAFPAMNLQTLPVGDVLYVDDVVVQRPASPISIATDGGFEATGWPVGYIQSTEQHHSGTKSLKVTAATGFDYMQLTLPWGTKLAVVPGKVYSADLWVYPHSSNTGGGTFELAAKLSDSTGAMPDVTMSFFNTTVPATGSWTKLSGSVTIPYGYDSLIPAMQLHSVPVGDRIYLDDLSIIPAADTVTVWTTSPVTNTNATSQAVALVRPRSGSWAEWDLEADCYFHVVGASSGKVGFVDLRPTSAVSGEWPSDTTGNTVVAAGSRVAITARTPSDTTAPLALTVGAAPSGGTPGTVIPARLNAVVNTHDLPTGNYTKVSVDSGQVSKVALTVDGVPAETVYAITDGAAFEINPANGTVQTVTLGASRTPKGTYFLAGQSVTLMIAATSYTVTWTDSTLNPTWVGGTAPTLSSTKANVIVLWKVGATLYGALVGTA